MNRIRNTILELILNRRGPEQKHVLLNEFSGLVQCFTAAIDGLSGLIINGRPLSVFRVGNIATSDT